MDKYAQIHKFWKLAEQGRNAALDINKDTGDLIVRCTKSAAGEGIGAIPVGYSDNWLRIVSSANGSITHTIHSND